MTARIFLVAANDFDDPPTIEAALEHAYLTLRKVTEPPMLLMTWEPIAESWWCSHGLLLEPVLVGNLNPHVRVNSAVTRYPDLVLLFGVSKFVGRVAEKAARLNLTVISIP